MSNCYVLAFAATIAGLCAATGARADDPTHADPSWSSCYVGINAGYSSANSDASDLPFADGPFAGLGVAWNSVGAPYETIGTDGSGATGGVEAGCDRQFDLGETTVVLGGVLDFSLADVSGGGRSAISNDTQTSFDLDWMASARVRAGVATSDVLFYATGGVALAGIDVRAFDIQTAPTGGMMDVSGGGTESGWVAGAGIEWRIQPNWSIGLEYLHYDFGSVTATGAAIEPSGAFPRFDNDIDADVIRIGLKWRM